MTIAPVIPFRPSPAVRVAKDPAGRPPPHDLAAERTLISSVVDVATMAKDGRPTEAARRAADALARVPPDAFFSPEHHRAWDVLRTMRATHTPIDVTTAAPAIARVSPEVASNIVKDLDGGANVTTILHTHADTVMKLWTARRAIALFQRLASEGYSARDPAPLLTEAHAETAALARTNAQMNGAPAVDVLPSVYADLVNASDPGRRGVSWGWRACDRAFGRLKPGRVTVIGARPGVGKTNVSYQLAESIAMSPEDEFGVGEGVVFVSAELSTAELLKRQIGIRARVPECLMDGEDEYGNPSGFPRDVADRVVKVHHEVAGLAVHFIDGRDENDNYNPILPAQIEVACREVAHRMAAGTYRAANGAKFPPMRMRLVVIDYLQRLASPLGDATKGIPREQHVAAISKALANMAKTLDVHIIALAQVGREGDDPKREIRMSDLRESGQIEADAASIIFLSRPEDNILRMRQAKARFRSRSVEPVDMTIDRGLIGEPA